jgi:hypothetical protein
MVTHKLVFDGKISFSVVYDVARRYLVSFSLLLKEKVWHFGPRKCPKTVE